MIFRTWALYHDDSPYKIYPLEHKHTEVSMSQVNLKGCDKARGRYLEQLCSKHGFYWLLAHMVKETKDEDDYYGGEDEDSITLRSVVLPSG